MSYHKQDVVLENGSLNAEVNILAGRNTPPENIVVTYQGNSLLEGTETLDFYGYSLGNTTILTAVLATQVTPVASAVVKLDLSSAAKGCWKLRFVCDALTAGEEIAISVVTW